MPRPEREPTGAPKIESTPGVLVSPKGVQEGVLLSTDNPALARALVTGLDANGFDVTGPFIGTREPQTPRSDSGRTVLGMPRVDWDDRKRRGLWVPSGMKRTTSGEEQPPKK